MPSRRERANAIRALSMDAVQKANSGHPGAPMGMADIAEVFSLIRITPEFHAIRGVDETEKTTVSSRSSHENLRPPVSIDINKCGRPRIGTAPFLTTGLLLPDFQAGLAADDGH